MEYIAFDVHKRYTYAVVEDEASRVKLEGKILHELGALAAFLAGCELGSPGGGGDRGELVLDRRRDRKRGSPRLFQASKAKLMLGAVNKMDNSMPAG